MTPRLCIHCNHCEFYGGFPGTEVTPSEPAEWRCKKGLWGHVEHGLSDLDDPRSISDALTTATDCPEFETSPLGIELGVQ